MYFSSENGLLKLRVCLSFKLKTTANFLFPRTGKSELQSLSGIHPYCRAMFGHGSLCCCVSVSLIIFYMIFLSLYRRCPLRPHLGYNSLRMNCSMWRCRFGVYMRGGGFRFFLCHHLGPTSVVLFLDSGLVTIRKEELLFNELQVVW